MTTSPDLARLAALLTEPARAAMLMHLLDGRSWTAKELAKVAAVKPPTASVHLKKLVDAALILVTPTGRHRYFRLASDDIAHMIEQLARFAPMVPAIAPAAQRIEARLRHCRLCYNHLAGQVGVALTQQMVAKSWLHEAEPWYRLTDRGLQALSSIGISNADGRTCMDWSERRLHLAGALGSQLLQALLTKRWLQRDSRDRSLRVTPQGVESFKATFGVDISALSTIRK